MSEVDRMLEISDWMRAEGYTIEDMDFMWDFCVVFKHMTISRLDRSRINWRGLRLDLIKQIPGIYEEISKKVNYYSEEDGTIRSE